MARLALRWDESNEAHIARHGVEPWEVEEVVENARGLVLVAKERYRVTAPTRGGRYLTVFVDRGPYGREYYVVTARDATPRERRSARGR